MLLKLVAHKEKLSHNTVGASFMAWADTSAGKLRRGTSCTTLVLQEHVSPYSRVFPQRVGLVFQLMDSSPQPF